MTIGQKMHSSERTVTAVLTPDLVLAVRRQARLTGKTISAYIRDVLAYHVAVVPDEPVEKRR